MATSLGTFVMLVVATAGMAVSTFTVQSKVRMLVWRDPVPEEAYRNLGLWTGLQSLFVGILIGLCVSIPVTDYLFP